MHALTQQHKLHSATAHSQSTASWLSRPAVMMRSPRRGHMCGEQTCVRHTAGWHHPRGVDDWVTFSGWLCRLPSRCIADCSLTQSALYDCPLYLQSKNQLQGPALENPTQPSPVALYTRLYYYSNLNPINSKPTQSSGTRGGQGGGGGGLWDVGCVWGLGGQLWKYPGRWNSRRETNHTIFPPILEFSSCFCDIQQWLCSHWEGRQRSSPFFCWIHISLTIPNSKEKKNVLPFFNHISAPESHTHRVIRGAGNHSLSGDYLNTSEMLGKWKQRLACIQVFFPPLSSVDIRTWPWHAVDTE